MEKKDSHPIEHLDELRQRMIKTLIPFINSFSFFMLLRLRFQKVPIRLGGLWNLCCQKTAKSDSKVYPRINHFVYLQADEYLQLMINLIFPFGFLFKVLLGVMFLTSFGNSQSS
jgi:Sec-independent protein secretion pathway component TatC